jgi:hypothetical protein
MEGSSLSSTKPLPPTPGPYGALGARPIKLTPASRLNVRKIVAQCASEEDLPEPLVSSVLDSLETVGNAIWENNWLPGLRLARLHRRRRTTGLGSNAAGAATSTKVPATPTPTPGNTFLSSTMPIGLGLGSFSSNSPRQFQGPKVRGAELTEMNNRALAHLGDLISLAPTSESSSSTSSQMMHLVVTLTSGVNRHDIVVVGGPSSPPPPARIDFHLGEFTLPGHADSFSVSTFDICGIETWKSGLSTLASL